MVVGRWPLFRGGRYSEGAVSSGLTVSGTDNINRMITITNLFFTDPLIINK
jgi:hypothetical protein